MKLPSLDTALKLAVLLLALCLVANTVYHIITGH